MGTLAGITEPSADAMKFIAGHIKYSVKGALQTASFSLQQKSEHSGFEIDLKNEKIEKGESFQLSIIPKSEEIAIHEIYIEVSFSSDKPVFINGFQSWTDSSERLTSSFISPLHFLGKFFQLHRPGDAHFYPYRGDRGILHGYTFTYMRMENNVIGLIGSASEAAGYTIFKYNKKEKKLNIHKECRGLVVSKNLIIFDLVTLVGEENEVWDVYAAHIKPKPVNAPPRVGWASRHLYNNEISEKIIIDNLTEFTLKQIPIDVFQIEDGYQEAVGDWLRITSKFPNGMKYIAELIHAQGFLASLWLAPFICEKKSDVFKKHFDWVLKDKWKKPVIAGRNPKWGGKFYALDIYNSEFRAYLARFFEVALQESRFDMLKLDYLYAAAQTPRNGKSRGMIMTEAMAWLREMAGDKILLGNGAPLGPAFGHLDYCRISSDPALKWDNDLLKLGNYRERESVENSLTSALGRVQLSGRMFGVDPGVFFLRKEGHQLNQRQLYTLFLANNIFGDMVFLSDHIGRYSQEEINLLRSMFPHFEKSNHRVIDYDLMKAVFFDVNGRKYLAALNFSNMNRSLNLPGGNYFLKKASDGSSHFIRGDRAMHLQPYESKCLLIIPQKTPNVAGSTAHLFPGCELESVELEKTVLTVRQNPKIQRKNNIAIRVPGIGIYKLNGMDILAEEEAPDLWLVHGEYFEPAEEEKVDKVNKVDLETP